MKILNNILKSEQIGSKTRRSHTMPPSNRSMGNGSKPLRLPRKRRRSPRRPRLLAIHRSRSALRQPETARQHNRQLGHPNLLPGRPRRASSHVRRGHHGGRPRVQPQELDPPSDRVVSPARTLFERVHARRSCQSAHHCFCRSVAYSLDWETCVDQLSAR